MLRFVRLSLCLYVCFLRRKLVEPLFALSNIRKTCPKTHFSKPTCTVTVTHTQSRLWLFLPTLNRGDLKTCRRNSRKTNRRAQRWMPSCPSVWIWRGSSTCQDVQTERLNSPSEVICTNNAPLSVFTLLWRQSFRGTPNKYFLEVSSVHLV